MIRSAGPRLHVGMHAVGPLVLVLATACAGAPRNTDMAAPQTAGSQTATDGWQAPGLPDPTPLSAAEFARRRADLLGSMDDGVLVVFGAPVPPADYLPFTQVSDFRYLTGIREPGAAYVAAKADGAVHEWLFVQERDPAREVWEGARLGTAGARALTGLSTAPASRLQSILDSLAAAHGLVHTSRVPPRDVSPVADVPHAQQVLGRLRERQPDIEFTSATPLIRRQRGVKSATELDRIRRAVHISVLAHREAMRNTAPGMNEFEVRALLEYVFARNGAERPAYGSIVGSGPNSTTLHYQRGEGFMQAGDVLLIDAGASYDGYAADITRTFPVDGRFTSAQRAIYEIVLAAQKAAESKIRAGAQWRELSEAAAAELASGLARLGLIDAPDATYDCRRGECPQLGLFYMHGLGHGVGLDVHDPDVAQTPTGFRPGSAITIEPGLYIRRDAFDHLEDTPGNRAMAERLRPSLERYRDIGVRIEDVYVFDERGVERVSAGLPREIGEIERLMAEPGREAWSRRPAVIEWFRSLRPL